MSLSNSATRQIADYSNPNSLGSKLRSRRVGPLIAMIDKTYETYGKVNIIDVSGTKAYWSILPPHILSKRHVTVTVINVPDSDLPSDEEHFKFMVGDGCKLDHLEDNSFHIAHSNSVIEHVGDWCRMVQFSEEIRRIAQNIFVQTPYFWFPIEPHFMTPFFHWLPRPIRISLIMRFDLENHTRSEDVCQATAKLENYRLLDKQMLQALFPDARIEHERIMGITKSLLAIRLE